MLNIDLTLTKMLTMDVQVEKTDFKKTLLNH